MARLSHEHCFVDIDNGLSNLNCLLTIAISCGFERIEDSIIEAIVNPSGVLVDRLLVSESSAVSALDYQKGGFHPF